MLAAATQTTGAVPVQPGAGGGVDELVRVGIAFRLAQVQLLLTVLLPTGSWG